LFLVHRFLSPWWRRRQVPPKRRFLQEPHGVTTQKTPFFMYVPLLIMRPKETAVARQWFSKHISAESNTYVPAERLLDQLFSIRFLCSVFSRRNLEDYFFPELIVHYFLCFIPLCLFIQFSCFVYFINNWQNRHWTWHEGIPRKYVDSFSLGIKFTNSRTVSIFCLLRASTLVS
jgi:hypothetical protein